MIEGLLYEVSRTAGAATVLTALCCVCTGMIAILAARTPGDPRVAAAARTTRQLAVFGSGAALFGIATGIPYHWLAGELDTATFAVVEGCTVLLLAGWALVAAGLAEAGPLRGRLKR